MEGLADDVLREVLTRVEGYDHAVTEFVRVSGTVLPPRAFTRLSPELRSGSATSSGTPVRVQLLGSDPACMADNAAQLVRLNPAGIDLNFGCPAPTVNRHRGGRRCSTSRSCSTPSPARCAGRCRRTSLHRQDAPGRGRHRQGPRLRPGPGRWRRGGLVVHARTKNDGYRPPAHWEWVGRIADVVAVPVVANGEVWTEDDWRRCRAVSGATDVMLGRGAVADPFLVRRIRAGADAPADRAAEWAELQPLIGEFWLRVLAKVEARHAPGRLKQWLNLLRRNFPRPKPCTALRPGRSAGQSGPGRPRRTAAAGGRVELPDVRQFQASPRAPSRVFMNTSRRRWPSTPAAFRKPYLDYNKAAFEASLAGWDGKAPLILDAGCGVGHSTIQLARAFPDHWVIGVDQSEDRLSRKPYPDALMPTTWSSCAPIWWITGA
jgi:tRNA-dihydrouridine synthase C